jgi:hypothetical protein
VFKQENEEGKPWSEKELSAFLIEFASKLVLFGSENVVKAYSRFRRAFSESPSDHRPGFEAFGNVLLAIREDLGHSNKDLSLVELFTLFINDAELILLAPPDVLKAAIERDETK